MRDDVMTLWVDLDGASRDGRNDTRKEYYIASITSALDVNVFENYTFMLTKCIEKSNSSSI